MSPAVTPSRISKLALLAGPPLPEDPGSPLPAMVKMTAGGHLLAVEGARQRARHHDMHSRRPEPGQSTDARPRSAAACITAGQRAAEVRFRAAAV